MEKLDMLQAEILKKIFESGESATETVKLLVSLSVATACLTKDPRNYLSSLISCLQEVEESNTLEKQNEKVKYIFKVLGVSLYE